MDVSVLRQLTQRPADSHKFDYGHVLVIGGSVGMAGAPLLAARAVLRSGAGLVTLAAEADVLQTIGAAQPELLTLQLSNASGVLECVRERRVSCIVIGSGMKPDGLIAELLPALMRQAEVQLVIDGGALTVLSNHLSELHNVKLPAILTPHPGEFQRLMNNELPAERSAQEKLAAEFSQRHRAIVILKGQHTFVAGPDGESLHNDTGNPGMATAGSGDVLTGIVGALIAQGIEPIAAAANGVYLHGLAGDLAAGRYSQTGMIAGDIIQSLPEAWLTVSKSNE